MNAVIFTMAIKTCLMNEQTASGNCSPRIQLINFILTTTGTLTMSFLKWMLRQALFFSTRNSFNIFFFLTAHAYLSYFALLGHAASGANELFLKGHNKFLVLLRYTKSRYDLITIITCHETLFTLRSHSDWISKSTSQ